MNITELNTHIIEWAKERELDTKGTVEAQAIKTVEELSELIKAICKDKKEDIIDSIGDVYVTLVIGNMLDEKNNMTIIQEQVDMLLDYKTIKNYKKARKVKRIEQLGKFIYIILNYNYSLSVIFDLIEQLINIAYIYDLDFVECVESAYNTIKNRTGKLVNGMYVKDEDLASGAAQKATPDFTNEIIKKIGNESVKYFFDGFTNA